ncbi:MAG: tRNA epoxyqueuosine(34) reductase QueG [Thermomicrobiales bacterium]
MNAPATISIISKSTHAARLSRVVRELAHRHGLSIAAITTASPFADLEPFLNDHISAGRVNGLDWFTPERARFSLDPCNLMPSARSILSVGVDYRSVDPDKPDDMPRGRIARYAWGLDYHKLLKTRMRSLHRAMEREVGRSIEARFLVDTARIVDRAVAARSGLGWYGKNSCIIVPGHGSWVLLGELVLDLELQPDEPLAKNCGRCQICLDRCPTGAISAPYTIETPRCLSFQTIEQRGSIPRELRAKMGDWVFGCDICQEVCPYTKAVTVDADPAFSPRTIDNAYPSLARLLTMDQDGFSALYAGTPVTRAKRRGLARNAVVVLGNIGTDDDLPLLLKAMTAHDEPLVRAHAAWAVGHIGGSQARNALESSLATELDETVIGEVRLALEALP